MENKELVIVHVGRVKLLSSSTSKVSHHARLLKSIQTLGAWGQEYIGRPGRDNQL